MSLKFAILGLLSYKPQTGYELKANLEQSIRYIWNADQAQIYRTLAEITQDGLVASDTVQQTGRPNKKVYHLTKTGEEELKRWLSGPVPSRGQHNTELVQIFFSGQIPDEEVLANLRRIRCETEAGLAGMLCLKNGSELFSSKNSPKRVRFFFDATLELGLRSLRMNIEWLNEMIEKIENGGLSSE